jgi:hypothetical protein
MAFFNRLFSLVPPQKAAGRPQSGTLLATNSQLYSQTPLVPPSSTSRDVARRELVRVALRDVRRAHAIPLNWVDCEVMVLPGVAGLLGLPGDTRMLVTLQVLQWDDRLVKYSLAIQRRLIAQVLDYDPTASQWLRGVVWEFPANLKCAFADMPDAKLWAQPAAKARQSVDVLDRRAARRTGDISQRKNAGPSVHVKSERAREDDYAPTRQAGL